MENYQVTIGVEPTNDYDKAKQDLEQALGSIRKLSPWQQQMLAEEFVGMTNVAFLIKLLNQGLGR